MISALTVLHWETPGLNGPVTNEPVVLSEAPAAEYKMFQLAPQLLLMYNLNLSLFWKFCCA